MSRSGIVDLPIDVSAIVGEVQAPGHGAIATFLGTVRGSSGKRVVTGLEYSAYVEMAEREMADIVREAAALASGAEVVAVHRVGNLVVGDSCVMIAVGHAHRGPAFDACRYVIEEIKKRVPIWKREHYADGSTEWVNAAAPQARAAGTSA
ncbi:MAG: molybdenum cofactor biosynthesis protein MoaE [Gemmatimonadaceae bacterium]